MTMRSIILRLDPRRSIRARFALVVGASGVALALFSGWWVERVERQHIQDAVAQAASQRARVLGLALRQGLNQRLALLQQLASQPVLASGLMEPGDQRLLLEQLRANQPEFAWLGIASARGRVEVATNALLVGQNLAGDAFFRAGAQGPWIGQRHLPERLARQRPLGRDGQPLALLDMAVPLINYQGKLFGVLLAELDWPWVEDQLQALTGPLGANQVLLLGRDGQPQLALPGPAPATPALQQLHSLERGEGTAVLPWPDGSRQLTTVVTALADGPDQRPAFTLVVRQAEHVAFASAEALRRRIALAGAAGALAFMLLATWLSGRVSRPLQELANTAQGRMAGHEVHFPAFDNRQDEVRVLAGALRGLDADLRQRLAELQASSARYQALFEGSQDAMYVRVQGRMVLANQACLRLFGVDHLDKMLALSLEQMFPEEEAARIQQRVHRLTVLREPVPLIEQRIRRHDGSMVDVETMATPFDDNGRPGFHVVMRDITERKRADEALRASEAVLRDKVDELHRAQDEVKQLNAELEQRVQARTAQLQSANAELDSFAYAVSHDLRAPLRAMSGFSQALLEDHGSLLPAQGRLYLDQITIAARRMGDLIDGLLTLSRSTRGLLRHDPVDLARLARHALDELRQAEPQRQVQVDLPEHLWAEGDARMLDVVLRNLLGNAWKYSARTPEARITLGERNVDGQRWYVVQDNGAGFDMAHASRLFQAFQRMHRQDEFPGLGIGLATVQRIIHRHGGRIEAESAPGQGALFRFTLASRGATQDEAASGGQA
jgi:PAS domain S-box-containing protein